MTDKQIKLDGRFIPKEEAIKAGLLSEKDIDVPSKRLDRIDKMEIDLANYEQMELDIEKIIEPYQLNWELDCLSLPSAIQSILERKEQECKKWKNAYEVKEDSLAESEEYCEELEEKLSNKRKECDELHETVKSQKEEIKNLNYTLYEERNLTTDLAKANLKISALKRDLSSARNRFKHENQTRNEQLDQLKAENDELRKNLVDKHTSRCFRLVTHREFDKLIMETVQLRQENKKLKQTLTEIKEMLKEICIEECLFDWNKTNKKHCGDCDCRFMQLLEKISECEVGNV